MSERTTDTVALAVTFDDGNVLIIPHESPPFIVTPDSQGWIQFQKLRNQMIQLRIPTYLGARNGMPVIYPDPGALLSK